MLYVVASVSSYSNSKSLTAYHVGGDAAVHMCGPSGSTFMNYCHPLIALYTIPFLNNTKWACYR